MLNQDGLQFSKEAIKILFPLSVVETGFSLLYSSKISQLQSRRSGTGRSLDVRMVGGHCGPHCLWRVPEICPEGPKRRMGQRSEIGPGTQRNRGGGAHCFLPAPSSQHPQYGNSVLSELACVTSHPSKTSLFPLPSLHCTWQQELGAHHTSDS